MPNRRVVRPNRKSGEDEQERARPYRGSDANGREW